MVALNDIGLHSVKDVEPHSSSEKLGTPFNLWVNMRLAHRSVANILCKVVGCHSEQSITKEKALFSGWLRVCRLLQSEKLWGQNNMYTNNGLML